jgi:hypothetical protein
MHILLIILLLAILFPALVRIVGSMMVWMIVAAVMLALVGMAFK